MSKYTGLIPQLCVTSFVKIDRFILIWFVNTHAVLCNRQEF